jgi:RHS repeat-associated protein
MGAGAKGQAMSRARQAMSRARQAMSGARRGLAAVVVVALAATMGGSAVNPSRDGEGPWSEAERRRESAEILAELVGEGAERGGVEVAPAIVVPGPGAPEPDAMAAFEPKAPRWPSAGLTVIDVGAVDTGGFVHLASADDVGRVELQVAGRALTARAGVDGVLLEVSAGELASGSVEIGVDYSAFADAYGGDWSSRLALVALPNCALVTPEDSACREQTALASTNDTREMTVSATLDVQTMGVLALMGGASGSAGDWAATPLSPSATWQVSAQTGDFSWSYPMRVPPAPGGPEPDLALLYSAASLDGRSAGANNQSTWIGDGWSLTEGYVERKYVPCLQDTDGGNNSAHSTEDLCWDGENVTLVFDGQANELVKDAATGTWRIKDDDGSRVELLTGGWNADDDGEYWKLTTTDGSQFFFGRGKRAASDTLELGSAWTVPVFGNHPGEPCYDADFAASSCVQGWRWNLEYAVDTSDNTLTYVYAPETNYYKLDATTVTPYVRGGYLTHIEYGQRQGSEEAGPAPLRVDFTVAERCLPEGGVTCGPAELQSSTASHWPDVPFDLICTAGACEKTQPSFFTRKRLTGVTTSYWTGSAYQDVDSWTFEHLFPTPGDGTSPAMWLESIGHQGLVGAPVTLPDVTFRGAVMPNRVDTTTGPPMNRYRVAAIDTEAGATISVNYTAPDCGVGDVPAVLHENTRRCFPVIWDKDGTLTTEFFHKYLTTSVVADPRDGTSQAVETHYDYIGDPAWHYNDSPLVPENRWTWGEWRGYATVDVITGAPSATVRSATRYRYFRGMHGDHLPTGTRVVQVDGVDDVDRLNGFLREQITYNGPGGPELSGSLNAPWISPATATGANGTTAAYLDVAQVDSRVTASTAPGGVINTRVVTTFDDTYGLPVQVDDLGDITTPTDDRCARSEYVHNTTAHLIGAVKRSEAVAVSCAATPNRPDDVIADARVSYDGGAYGDAPTRGLATTAERVAEYVAGSPVYVTESTTTYDDQGRPLTATDAIERTTTSAYTPATGGPATAVTATSPDPDGAGPLTAHVSTTTLKPAWGVPTQITDANGKVTTASYDGLGRLTGVWQPGRVQGTDTADVTYAYVISNSAPNTVTTSTLTAAEGYVTSVELLDGLLRSRQSQSPSADRDNPGRVVTDTVYDTRGLVAYANGPWFTTGAPGGSLVTSASAVPSRTRYVYDGAGRAVQEIFDVADQERMVTTTVYDGDRTAVQPPEGATPQMTINDARGRLTELRQYTQGSLTGAYQSTSYDYDARGNLAAVTDPAGNTWTYTYDLRGRLVASDDPDRGATSSTFDDAGQVVSTTDARGETLFYVRDVLGRAVELREGSGSGALRASWSYDSLAKGLVSSATRHDAGGDYVTAVTGYDDGYRPLGQSVSLPAGEGEVAGTWTTSYAYAPNGQLVSMTLPAGGGLGAETVTTHYDGLSVPEWMSGGSGFGTYVAGSAYSAFGEALAYDLGAGSSVTVGYAYEYGTRRLDRTWVSRAGGSGFDLDLTYSYDPAGNPVSVTDSPTSGAVDAQCYAYDGLRRLTSAWTPAGGDCAAAPSVGGLGGPAPYWTDYAFDEVGSRTTVTSHAAGGDTVSTYTYPTPGGDSAHQVTEVEQVGPGGTTTDTFAYDDAGSTVERALDGEPVQTLVWDVEGELVEVFEDDVTVGEYVYTADGERLVRRQDGVTTVYLPGGQELIVERVTGQVTATRYYTFNGNVVATRTDPGITGAAVLVSDPHGTAELTVDGTGAVTRRRTDPYGNPRGTVPAAWPGDHGFLDKPLDDTGLVAIGARYYDPALGRFVSVDPVMDLTDPQQWHGYTYANNNPITYTDPTGLTPYTPGGTPPPKVNNYHKPAGTPKVAKPAKNANPPVKPRRESVIRALIAVARGSLRASVDFQVGAVINATVPGMVNNALNLAAACSASAAGCLYEYESLVNPGVGIAESLVASVGAARDHRWEDFGYAHTSMKLQVAATVGAIMLATSPPTAGAAPRTGVVTGEAAETGAARFTVNSAGEATMSLRAGSTSLEVSEHAALRMTQRGISIDAAEATLAQQPFPYFHQGAWKTGFYDPASRIFLGSVNGEVTTVIRGASPNYINNLKAATP